MSIFNRKGYRTLLGRTNDGEIKPFAIKTNHPLAIKHSRNIMSAKKERQKAFREYKKNLRDAKKKVPLSERSKINWSRLPEQYL